MATTSNLADQSLSGFGRGVAASTSVPGSGSVAAGIGVLGAGLVSMAFRRTAGEGLSGPEAYARGRAEELEALLERFIELVDQDAAAYAAWSAARRERAAGAGDAAALERARREALDAPIEVMETAVAALRLAAVGAADCKPSLATECLAGARALRTSLECGGDVVLDNLRADPGAPPGARGTSDAIERRDLVALLCRQGEELFHQVRVALEAGRP